MNYDMLQKIDVACSNAEDFLRRKYDKRGFWEGRLSSSALATAVAALAWMQADEKEYVKEITFALDWLLCNVNSDGGWGDTPQSQSNLATTLLVWSTISASADMKYNAVVACASRWIEKKIGGTCGELIAKAVTDFYGDDRTFSVPILTHCAIAGVLGASPWYYVPQLPFELAVLPSSFYNFINFPVVSYAMPALISIGIVRYRLGDKQHGFMSLLRQIIISTVINKLARMQPSNGGFLEAVPLTGFVVMSLSACGLKEHDVVCKGIKFLCLSQREDGSLPIDTDLSMWLTTHAVRALSGESSQLDNISPIKTWIITHQCRGMHYYNNSRPGGWAWTDKPGGVPDADDTSGVLLALVELDQDNTASLEIEQAVNWLLGLQNRDGGFPTFCRGNGSLPFDQSSPDITAHAIHALAVCAKQYNVDAKSISYAIDRSMKYLSTVQAESGAWIPLWFGNQHVPGRINPVFGTALVCAALSELKTIHASDSIDMLLRRGIGFLLSQQNTDGGWGGIYGVRSSVEETSLAVFALSDQASFDVIETAAEWIINATDCGAEFPATPIGLYFSSLWYSEELYPVIFSIRALKALKLRCACKGGFCE